MNKLIVLGSVNADHVLQVPDFPRPGETLIGHHYQVIPGGKGANQAVAAARLQANIGFIASVGDDDFGRNILQAFEQDGINTKGIKMATNTPTGIAMIQVSAAGENCICLSPEANNLLTPSWVEQHKAAIAQAEFLLTQLETPLEGIELALQYAQQHQTKVVLNPAPARPLPDALLAKVDIITPNETEAEVLTGITVHDDNSAQLAANHLHQKGIKTVIITLGSRGVWLSQSGKGELIPGFKVEVVDTTAAGDTFNAAFVTGLIETMPIIDAIQFSHAAAALSVTSFGAQTSIPTRQQTEQFLLQQLS